MKKKIKKKEILLQVPVLEGKINQDFLSVIETQQFYFSVSLLWCRFIHGVPGCQAVEQNLIVRPTNDSATKLLQVEE